MGGVDDDEPPRKRVKGSSLVSGNFSNISSVSGPTVPLGGSMARPLPSKDKEDLVGKEGVIKRVEFVKIITKALYSLGFEKAGAVLEEESGIQLHTPVINLFRKQVLDGNWDNSVVTLHKICSLDECVLKLASFLILEQKFFEYLEKDRVMDALKTLRYEITPLNINRKRVHELSNYIVSTSKLVMLGFANLGTQISNSRPKLLEELQKLFPPAVMIPEQRLEHLVEQALDVQRQDCFFHNSLDASLSLYTDHLCGKDQIPSRTTQIRKDGEMERLSLETVELHKSRWQLLELLEQKDTEIQEKNSLIQSYLEKIVLQAHRDEVWFLQFSNHGKFLASSSKDKSAIIWEVHDNGEVVLKHTLTGHEKPVLMLAWSPDDCQLLTCGMEEVVRLWDCNSGECLHVYEKNGFGLNSCGWFPDGKRFFSGVTDMSICLWDVDGKELECWKGQRMLKASDMAVTKDGKRIISICRENVIVLLDRKAKLEKLIDEEQTIISFSLSSDDNFLLINLLNQEIHLWSIMGDPKLVTKYKGHKRERYVIRSCFGGLEQAFIASGSEDSQVYIWHRQTGKLVHALPGHSGSVNCVSWNPANPHMLASASDDHSVRIWGLNRVNMKLKDTYSNGITRWCNGNSK